MKGENVNIVLDVGYYRNHGLVWSFRQIEDNIMSLQEEDCPRKDGLTYGRSFP